MNTNTNKSVEKNNLLERLDRLLEWIKSCDTKASIVIAGIGIFITIFTSEHNSNMINYILKESFKNINFANILYLLFFALSWCVFIYGTYCLVQVLVPRLKKEANNFDPTQRESLYFFEDIAKNRFTDFKEKLENQTEEQEIEDIAFQVYVNAKICSIKFDYFKKGILASITGIAGIIIMFMLGQVIANAGGF